MISLPARPAVSCREKDTPSSVSTTWRALPILDLRIASVPLSGLKSVTSSRAQFAVAAAGLQCRLHQRAELGIAGVDEPPRLRDRQISNPRRIDAFEGFDFTPSGV